MYRRGSASWRFEQDNAQFLHLALFVRDAARLPVAPSAAIPPCLAGEVPDHAAAVPSGEQDAAAGQWAAWWGRLLTQAAREARRPRAQAAGTDPLAHERDRIEGREQVFDPPEFGSLAGLPAVQAAAIATFADAVQWSGRRDGQLPARSPEPFPWALVRDAAEGTAAELGIPIGDLDAVTHVLDVTGSWSYLVGPGCALCSAAVAADPPAAGRLLHDLFGSGRRR